MAAYAFKYCVHLDWVLFMTFDFYSKLGKNFWVPLFYFLGEKFLTSIPGTFFSFQALQSECLESGNLSNQVPRQKHFTLCACCMFVSFWNMWVKGYKSCSTVLKTQIIVTLHAFLEAQNSNSSLPTQSWISANISCGWNRRPFKYHRPGQTKNSLEIYMKMSE